MDEPEAKTLDIPAARKNRWRRFKAGALPLAYLPTVILTPGEVAAWPTKFGFMAFFLGLAGWRWASFVRPPRPGSGRSMNVGR